MGSEAARGFYALPIDVLLHIFRELDVPDLFTLRRTCRSLDTITRDRSVWHEALVVHFLRKGVPTPGLYLQDVSALSSQELELITVRAHRLRSNWTAAEPRFFKQLTIRPTSRPWAAAHSRNLAAEFLPGWNGRYLLTLTLFDSHSERENRRYSFELWDISASEPKLLAELLVAGLLGFAINTVPKSDHVLAVTRRDGVNQLITTTYTADFGTPGYEAWFRRKNEFDSFRQLLGLHGSYCIVTGEDQVVRIIHIESGRPVCALHVPLIHADPTLRLPEQRCIEYEIIDNFVVTFCTQWIYLYKLPFRLDSSAHQSDPAMDPPSSEVLRLDPIATHKWRWRIDTIVVNARRSLSLSPSTLKPPALDLAIRFDTWFPWPVNILHHFVLPCNPTYSPSTFSPSDSSTFPYLASQDDVPFMVQAIPSPLRIFTPSDVVFGSYGTILWLDASTDSTTPSQAGDRGQRIAMKVITRHSPAAIPESARARIAALDDQVSPAHVGEAEVTASLLGTLSLEDTGSSAVDTLAQTSVLHMQETHEYWNRVSVNEEEGQVAVGYVDGRVAIYTYVPPM